MQNGPSHDRGLEIVTESKQRVRGRARLVAVIVAAAMLVGVRLALPATQIRLVQAQESEVTSEPGQRPGRSVNDGTGRGSGGQAGNRGDGGNRPVRPGGVQPDASPGDMSSEQMPAGSDAGTPEASGVAPSRSFDQSSSIVAIAGVDGATLTDRPQGMTLYTVPMGTALQAAGRTDDGKWLYVVRDAVTKGGEEVEPALAGWAPVTYVFAFSIENLPVLDVETTSISLPKSSLSDGPHRPDTVDDLPESSLDDAVETAAEPESEKNFDSQDTGGEALSGATGSVNLVDSRLNLRAGPDTTAAMVGKLQPNQSVTVLGRNEDSTWLLVSDGLSPDPVGWAAADFIDVNGDLETLPVESAPMISSPSSTSAVAPADVISTDDLPTSPAEIGNISSGSSDVIVIQTSPGATFYAYSLTDGALWPLDRGFDPAISPDGRTVAFTRDGGENGIYLVDLDGGNERRIFAERGRLASPKWSPDGEWIAFSRGDTFAECYQMGPACLTATQIREQNPNIDLSRLELVREPRYHLAMVDVSGHNYTDIAALDTARAPDWIEAGIVYQSSAGLQITDALPDVENRRVIDDYLKPYFHDPDWQPSVGPGGGRIVYMGKEGSHWEIFTVNPDGSGVTALTRPSTTLKGVLPSNVAPAWSPDGSRIAFLSNRADKGGSDIWRLWIMDADGSNQRPLPIDLALDYTFGDEQAVGW